LPRLVTEATQQLSEGPGFGPGFSLLRNLLLNLPASKIGTVESTIPCPEGGTNSSLLLQLAEEFIPKDLLATGGA
jgi:hypothetical protein